MRSSSSSARIWPRRTPPGSGSTRLDLTDPFTIDTVGGPGWEQVTAGGAVTMVRESYLLLPLADEFADATDRTADLSLELVAASLDVDKTIEVIVNGVAIDRVAVGRSDETMIAVTVPAAMVVTHQPLEVVVQATRPGLRPRPAVYLRILRLRLAR